MKFALTRFRIFIASALATFIFCTIIMVGANFILDPLHILRPPAEKTVYDREPRFAVPGMIHYNQSPHAVVGTSVVQDFDEATYERVFGTDISRYILTGGTAYEQRRMIETLLAAPNPPKLVIWGVDPLSFSGELNALRWAKFPEYLYSPTPSKWRYIFSFESFARLVRQIPDALIFKNFYSEEQRLRSGHKEAEYKRDAVYGAYCGEKLNERLARLSEFDFSTQDAQIETHLKALIAAHPQTEFIVFYPPYSLAQFAEYQKGDVLDDIYAFREKSFAALSTLENVRIFDFQQDLQMISSFRDYRDSVHYGAPIMRDIISAFYRGRSNIRSLTQIQQGQRALTAKLKDSSIWEDIQSYCTKDSQPVSGL